MSPKTGIMNKETTGLVKIANRSTSKTHQTHSYTILDKVGNEVKSHVGKLHNNVCFVCMCAKMSMKRNKHRRKVRKYSLQKGKLFSETPKGDGGLGGSAFSAEV